jgi:hypothetical protein
MRRDYVCVFIVATAAAVLTAIVLTCPQFVSMPFAVWQTRSAVA